MPPPKMAPPKTLPHADWHGGTAILARELGPERGSARFHSRQPSPAKARRADTLPWRVQSAAPSEPPTSPGRLDCHTLPRQATLPAAAAVTHSRSSRSRVPGLVCSSRGTEPAGAANGTPASRSLPSRGSPPPRSSLQSGHTSSAGGQGHHDGCATSIERHRLGVASQSAACRTRRAKMPSLCGCSVSDPDGRWQVSPLALGKSGGRDAIDPLQPHGRPRLEDTG
ncbi:hypothetical protein ACCO45_006995 [Purpureocillium lilacinum]|uniref:Uncharacterized protein n=1 Tax=Purpureocillium lilacinum TaxID=33203 RepID=A0ACC4DS40_PURLI